MHSRHDDQGYLPIAAYGVLGDGRSAALVGIDGRIDWWAVPTLDSPPVFAGLLDPDHGGHFSLAPATSSRTSQRYVDRTNVLTTIHETGSGTVRVVDSLNTGSAGRLPWNELARRVEGVDGEVEMEWAVVPGHRLAGCRPCVTRRQGVPVICVEDQMLAMVTHHAGDVEVDHQSVRGRFTISEGNSALIALIATDTEPLPIQPADAVSARIDRTADGWRRWSGLISVEGDYAAPVLRSALSLKLLLTESTGAIAAAATTSLPESVGGSKNWDYRYSWVRDSSFALDALIQLGLHEEVHGAVSWLLDAIRRNGGDLQVCYSLGGGRLDECIEVDVPGWRDSRPVRSGNAAARQTQLGNYGDLFDTVCRYAAEGHIIDQRTGAMLVDLAESCCDHWLDRDSGIWELDDLQHYTISKIGCWVALDRSARLARAGQIAGDRLERWEATAGEIRSWVRDNCWSEAKQAYTFHAGTNDLDAAVLLAGRTGFDRSERLSTTIDAIRAELGRGPHLYRYTGMDKEEGAFVACTFWLVDALVRTGRLTEAQTLMDEAVTWGNHAGLLAEQIDPATGDFLGNIPQALSHLALINAAFAMREGAAD